MSDIADFLRARYAEQRMIAEGATPGAWRVVPEGDAVVAGDNEKLVVGVRRDDGQGAADLNHIYVHSPELSIADLDVKLAIVDEHGPREVTAFDADGWEHTSDACQTCLSGDDWPCRTIRLLARPFAGHPDHKGEEWAP